LKDLEKKLLRIESQLQAEKAEKQRLLRQVKELRSKSVLFDAIVDQLDDHIPPVKPLPGARAPLIKRGLKNPKKVEHLVAHLSDMHADEIVLPSQTNGIEDYDFQIACLRAEKYVEEILETVADMSTYYFPVLWLLSYGDQSSGEIHGNIAQSYFQNQLDNCLNIGKLQSLMIRDLAPYFEKINVVCLPGNHGRRSKRKDFHNPRDSWDYLISRVAELNLKDHGNVKFIIPDAYSINLEINKQIFNIQHGDGIKSWNSIPFYGVERKTRRLQALHREIPISCFVMGHFHQASDIPSGRRSRVLINGPWAETSHYAYDELGEASEPHQWLHGCHEKRAITWQKKISLKTPGERSRVSGSRYLNSI
jgi:hypothetical protein